MHIKFGGFATIHQETTMKRFALTLLYAAALTGCSLNYDEVGLQAAAKFDFGTGITGCRTNHDCASGQVCSIVGSTGSCISIADFGVSGCRTNNDCPQGQICSITGDVGMCISLQVQDMSIQLPCNGGCPQGQVCTAQNVCVLAGCGNGQTNCNNVLCANTATDPLNCGACGHVCAQGQVCQNGTCTVSCNGGFTNCGGACVNTASDTLNCGSCGHVCAVMQNAIMFCVNSACNFSCVNGYTSCSGSCVNTATDFANCGACGHVCPNGTVCQGGACNLQCAGGTTNCGGACVNTLVDNANCGGCARICGINTICQNGACVQQGINCGNGLTNCNNICLNLQNDNANCGKCGNACAQNTGCFGGACVFGCGGGLTNCGNNVCADLTSDQTNCGACGKACLVNQMCQGGACAACGGGKTLCGGKCLDVQTDNANCGKCANACAQGQTCNAGLCTSPQDMIIADMVVINNCQQGLTLCNNACVDLTSDRFNCGKCGKACQMGDWCNNSACDIRAPYLYYDCNDSNHCVTGYCTGVVKGGLYNGHTVCTFKAPGDPCGVDADCNNKVACVNGTCGGQPVSDGGIVGDMPDPLIASCGDGVLNNDETDKDCGGSCCTDKNVLHCCWPGQLCKAKADCNGGADCTNGRCACAQGFLGCGAWCANPLTDSANCGKCGNACQGGRICIGGVCI